MDSLSTQSSSTQSKTHNKQLWYRPTLSPEHGVYVILGVSFLTGAEAAQQWTWATTLALVCVYCGFQAEHPLVLQIKQRHSWKPRFLLWIGIYGGIASVIALWLYWHSQEHWPLLMITGYAIVAALVDSLSVWRHQQKSVLNELMTFSGICLSAPLAYVATSGTLSATVLGLWALNSLFFSSSIFTVKLRKVREASVTSGLIFHSVSVGLVLAFWQLHWLAPLTAVAIGVAPLKFGLILWKRDWYCHAPIQQVAQLETGTSLLFFLIVSLSLLPPTLG